MRLNQGVVDLCCRRKDTHEVGILSFFQQLHYISNSFLIYLNTDIKRSYLHVGGVLLRCCPNATCVCIAIGIIHVKDSKVVYVKNIMQVQNQRHLIA